MIFFVLALFTSCTTADDVIGTVHIQPILFGGRCAASVLTEGNCSMKVKLQYDLVDDFSANKIFPCSSFGNTSMTFVNPEVSASVYLERPMLIDMEISVFNSSGSVLYAHQHTYPSFIPSKYIGNPQFLYMNSSIAVVQFSVHVEPQSVRSSSWLIPGHLLSFQSQVVANNNKTSIPNGQDDNNWKVAAITSMIVFILSVIMNCALTVIYCKYSTKEVPSNHMMQHEYTMSHYTGVQNDTSQVGVKLRPKTEFMPNEHNLTNHGTVEDTGQDYMVPNSNSSYSK